MILLAALLLIGLLAVFSTANTTVHAASGASCLVSDRFPGKVLAWCDLISHYATEVSIPPDLIAALVWLESGGSPRTYSHSGAVGLMQVMPRDGTAAAFICKNGPCFHDRPAMIELLDPEFNIRYGSQMLRDLLDQHAGDVREALKAYGPMDAGYDYADAVLGLYWRYGDHP